VRESAPAVVLSLEDEVTGAIGTGGGGGGGGGGVSVTQLQIPVVLLEVLSSATMLAHLVVFRLNSAASRGEVSNAATDVLVMNPKGGLKPGLLLAIDSVWLSHACIPSATSAGTNEAAVTTSVAMSFEHAPEEPMILITPAYKDSAELFGFEVRLFITEEVANTLPLSGHEQHSCNSCKSFHT